MIKTTPWIAIAVACMVFAVVSGFAEDEASANAQATQAKPNAVEVNVVTVQRKPQTIRESLPGRTVAFELAEIRPQVSGILVERFFREGSRVKAGQQLYQIDPAPYQAVYDSALADLQKAEALVKPIEIKRARLEGLVEVEAVSKQEYDDLVASLAQAKAEVAIAKAEIARAKINLDYTKVYAPISGIISKSFFTKGALVTANQSQPLSIITQLDPIYVDISQPNDQLIQMRRKWGQLRDLPVELSFSDGKETYEHEGRLLFHEVAVDPNTGTVKLRAQFPNPDHFLLPGQFVRARLRLDESDVLVVPQKATQRQADGKLTVWVVQPDSTVQPVSITVDRALGNAWVVADGLEDGAVIVIEGQLKLQPGVLVNPVPANTASGEQKKSGE